jgi:thymidine kinase
MFAGKTTAMLDQVRKLKQEGHTVIMVKASEDTRYSNANICTHNGDSLLADQIVNSLSDVALEALDILAIDELHFFKDAASTLK